LRDITPTIGEILGFNTEDATGSVMEEIILSAPDSVEEETDIVSLELNAAPNPFRQESLFHVRMPEPGYATIRVHDVTGGIVALPLQRHLPRGLTLFPWDGRTDNDRPLQMGIYFATLEAPTGSYTRRLILVRRYGTAVSQVGDRSRS
jgi:hypothetical protein